MIKSFFCGSLELGQKGGSLNMAVILIDEVKLALLLMKVVKIKSQNKSEKSAKGKRGLEVVR